jgi:hypothetical protein
MGRNHLVHVAGDAINAVPAAAGYNFRRLLAWLALLLAAIRIAFAPEIDSNTISFDQLRLRGPGNLKSGISHITPVVEKHDAPVA